MNLQQQEQFYQIMTGLKQSSRAASLPETELRVTEMGSNGVLISRPAKKVEYISQPVPKTSQLEPQAQAQVWNLTKNGPVLESKAASVPGINRLKVIHDFIRSNGRI